MPDDVQPATDETIGKLVRVEELDNGFSVVYWTGNRWVGLIDNQDRVVAMLVAGRLREAMGYANVHLLARLDVEQQRAEAASENCRNMGKGIIKRAEETAALRQRVAELERAGEWRPIETAPKDGTEILVYGDAGECDYTSDPLHYLCIAWWGQGQNWYASAPKGIITVPATHWLPLPPAPAAGSGEGG